MEPNAVRVASPDQADTNQDIAAITSSYDDVVTPIAQGEPCPTCRGGAAYMSLSYIYALGRFEARFPRLSVEKEFAQLVSQTDTAGKTDQQVFSEVLSKPENRYLVRQMCWVFRVQGLETYIVQPRYLADLELLVGAIRPVPSPTDIDIVVGVRGPIAPPELCNGLMVPIVGFDQIYSFTREELIRAIPKPNQADPEQFGPAAEEVFDRIMLMTDNAGATDEHRFLNYLAVRYPEIYAKAKEEFDRNFSLTAVEVRPSLLNSTRKVVEAIFSYKDRSTDFTEKFFVRGDVTDEFPFLVTKLSPYYDH